MLSNYLIRRVQTSALPSVTDGQGHGHGEVFIEDEFNESDGDGNRRGIPGEICVLLEFSSSSSSSSRGKDMDSRSDSHLASRYVHHHKHNATRIIAITSICEVTAQQNALEDFSLISFILLPWMAAGSKGSSGVSWMTVSSWTRS